MNETGITLEDLKGLATAHQEARERELKIKRDLARAGRELAELEKLTVNQAYQNKAITGSNKQTRDAEEAAVLAGSSQVQRLRSRVEELTVAADEAQVAAEATRLYAGLIKAWLYAQAGLEH